MSDETRWERGTWATLAIAALFQPLRQRIQAAIDRRFYRRKYDAARIVQAFSTRLRDEVDIGRLSVDLMDVVDQTLQPSSVSLWLRRQQGKRRVRDAWRAVAPFDRPRWARRHAGL